MDLDFLKSTQFIVKTNAYVLKVNITPGGVKSPNSRFLYVLKLWYLTMLLCLELCSSIFHTSHQNHGILLCPINKIIF